MCLGNTGAAAVRELKLGAEWGQPHLGSRGTINQWGQLSLS